MLAAIVVPWVTGWEVHARSERATATSGSLPPLHGFWDPRLGAGTAAAVLIALLGWRYAVDLADRLPWRRLLLLSYVVGLGWMLALALVDGPVGISRVLAHGYEYLATARTVDDVPALLDGFVQRIDGSNPDHWVTHVAGHPPGALLFFVALVRVGLGGDLAAGLAVIAVAATTAPAVLATVRTLGAEAAARRGRPVPGAGPSGGVHGRVGGRRLRRRRRVGTCRAGDGRDPGSRPGLDRVVAGGRPAAGLLRAAVLRAGPPGSAGARGAGRRRGRGGRCRWPRVRPCAWCSLFAAYGFAWWEGFAAVRERYWDGIAADRPAAYWLWGDLAALLVSAGPVLGAGLAALVVAWRRTDRAVVLLVAAAAAAVLVADLSRMSKAEVERIWLPFVPWLLLSTALLPESWRRWALALQMATALLVEVLLYTTW